MELWTDIRRRALTKELSKRAACRVYGVHWQALEKMLTHAESPGYRQNKLRARPTIELFVPIIQRLLSADRHAPRCPPAWPSLAASLVSSS